MARLSLRYFLPSFRGQTEASGWKQSGASEELLCGREAALGQSRGDWGDRTHATHSWPPLPLQQHSAQVTFTQAKAGLESVHQVMRGDKQRRGFSQLWRGPTERRAALRQEPRALCLAQPLPVSAECGPQSGQVPHVCWGGPAETLHQAPGLATAFNHRLQIQDQLISDPPMRLFTSFFPISLIHINARTGSFLKRRSGKPDTIFISLLEKQGKRGQAGTALCGFSDVSTANTQRPENPVPLSTLHKLSCTETHALQPSLCRKQSLQRRNLLPSASLFQTASANVSHHLLQTAAVGWERTHRSCCFSIQNKDHIQRQHRQLC